MHREHTDLLDVFRAKSARASGARAVSRPVRGEGAGVVLDRRRLLLGGSAAALLLVLAFVAGVAAGRGGAANGASPALAAPARRTAPVGIWLLRSRNLPRVGMGAQNLEQRALASFAERFPRLAPFLSSVPVEDGRGKLVPGQFALLLKGFEGRRAADEWRFQLAVWDVDGYLPFDASRPYPVD